MKSRRDWFLALALVVVTFLVYLPAWNGKPIWDDEIHLTPAKLSSLDGLARIWTEPAAAPQYYPLLHTVFWIENKLWGHWPLPYHLVGIALHALTALLVWRILACLKIPGAWLAVGIFALHPVMVESVAWISEIKNTLSGALCAAAALIYFKFDRDRKLSAYFVALAFFVAALLTKTVVVTLPAVLLIIFWWKRGTIDWKRDVAPLVPFFLVSLVAGLITVWVEQKFCAETGETFHYSLLDRVLIAGRLFWFYLGELFWPKNLTVIYPAWKIDASAWKQYLYPVVALVLFVALWLLRKKSRGAFPAAFVFLAMLSPVLGFFNLSYFMSAVAGDDHAAIFRADHFQYLATVAVIAPTAAALAGIAARLGSRLRPVIYAACGVLLVPLATLTYAHSVGFRDSETCFRDVIAKNPDSVTAGSNLGNVLLQKGAVDEAIVQFQRSVQIDPGYQFGRYNLAAALLEKGETDEAISQLRKVLNVDPNHPRAYYTLANALAKKGETEEAIAYYGRALKLVPDFPDAHCNLANVLLEKGDVENALVHYREALRLQPNNPQAHYNLAVGLVQKGDLEPAIRELQIALQLDPRYPDAEPLLRDLLAQRSRR